MAFFGGKVRKVLRELRLTSESRSNDLNREIREFLEELEEDYEENRNVVPEFQNFAEQLKTQLAPADASKLEEFMRRFSRVDRTARHGVEFMRELKRDQRKLSRETIWQIEEFTAQA